MITDQVPHVKGAAYDISTPIPDSLYGYDRSSFNHAGLIQMGIGSIANAADLLFPFLAIEVTGDGPAGSGSMWVATNQCIGDVVSCVNIAERLNQHLATCSDPQVEKINSAAFAIALGPTEARLLISWKSSDQNFYVKKIGHYCLQDEQHVARFHSHVKNILRWGEGPRMQEIQAGLDQILLTTRQAESSAVKPRSHTLDRANPERPSE